MKKSIDDVTVKHFLLRQSLQKRQIYCNLSSYQTKLIENVNLHQFSNIKGKIVSQIISKLNQNQNQSQQIIQQLSFIVNKNLSIKHFKESTKNFQSICSKINDLIHFNQSILYENQFIYLAVKQSWILLESVQVGNRLNKINYFFKFKQNLNSIPKEILVMFNLKTLSLLNCQIQKIYNLDNLDNLIFLASLGLENNLIKKIQNLQRLKSLNELYLQNNKIQKFQNIKFLTKLIKFRISQNSATEKYPTIIQEKTTLNFLKNLNVKLFSKNAFYLQKY